MQRQFDLSDVGDRSLVHPVGTICKWCKTDAATTVVYDWPTCVICAADRSTRVRRYLIDMNPYRDRESRLV